MNVLFLTLLNIKNIEEAGLYSDLMRTFAKHGHNVYIASATEKRNGQETFLEDQKYGHILHVKTGNIQKTNLIEKGFATISLEGKFVGAIKKYLSDVKFDLVLYSTPPVTLGRAVEYVKNRDGAKTYLLLKDIFPQNSVDLGMLSTTGIKSVIYQFFRNKEKKLYKLSDRIGCMSKANVEYLLNQDPWIDKDIVEVCPNSEEPRFIDLSDTEKKEIKEKYNLPLDKALFVYGGNLGKPQCVEHIVECIRASENALTDVHFVIAGSGTDKHYLDEYIANSHPKNVTMMDYIPKCDFEKLTAACDVGLIFLDYNFKIPNFPSRLITYMQAGLPVLCCTDPNTDVGRICEEGNFGWSSYSNDVDDFLNNAKLAKESLNKDLGKNARKYFLDNYTTEKSYDIITRGE